MEVKSTHALSLMGYCLILDFHSKTLGYKSLHKLTFCDWLICMRVQYARECGGKTQPVTFSNFPTCIMLENSSKSHMKSSVFLHVFNDISTCVYVFTEYFLHGFSNLSIEFYVVL